MKVPAHSRRPIPALDRRLLSVALFLTVACHRWAPMEVTPAELAEGRVKRIRVTTPEGHLVLDRPAMIADSLLGFAKPRADVTGPGTRGHAPEPRLERRYAVAVKDVTRVERRRVDVPATVLTATGTAAAVGAIVFAVVCGATDCISW